MKEGKYYKYAFLDWVSCHTVLVSTMIVFAILITVYLISFPGIAEYAILILSSLIFVGLLIFFINDFIIDILKSMRKYQ